MSPKNKVRVALVGLGYWGPKILRNLFSTSEMTVAAVCDSDAKRLARVAQPGVESVSDYQQILSNPNIDAVVLAVPLPAHYEMAKKALNAGKHVWVEKPLTNSKATAQELVDLAQKKGLVLFVDHTFLYNPAIQKMKEVIERGLLGNIYYFDSTRVNLGLVQSDINVVWDLAPHDLSILHYLIGSTPQAVSAIGASHITKTSEEIAYVHLHYPNNMIAHLNFNWLSPVKIRRIIVGGSQRLMVYDDMETSEKIKIYDKGVHLDGQLDDTGKNKILVSYRMGDMTAPYVENNEPLQMACKDFAGSILQGRSPLSDGVLGSRVVTLIEAIQKSLVGMGERVVV